MTVRISWQRSLPILDQLYSARVNGGFPFFLPNAELPQIIVPDWIKSDPEQLARFYWIFCLWNRGRVKTMTACRGLIRVVEACPDLLRPEFVVTLSQSQLVEILQFCGLPQMSKGNAKGWLENASRLVTDWDNKVLHLMTGLSSYRQALNRLSNRPATSRRSARGMYGYQKKMTSMLLYYLMYEGLMKPFMFPVPVDYRIMNFCLSKNMVLVKPDNKGNYRSDEMEDALRVLFFKYAKLRQANPLLLAEAIWLYVGVMCSRHPNNRTRAGRYNARGTTIESIPPDWTKDRLAFTETCGVCPFDSICQTTFPYQYYYSWGALHPVVRERPPGLSPPLFSRLGEPPHNQRTELRPRPVPKSQPPVHAPLFIY